MTSRSLLTRSRTGRGVAPPSGRAVVGGLVVTVAALALYGLGTSAASPPRVAVLAATRPIAPGATITVDDVTTVEIDAPADTVDELLAPPDLAAADGAIALGPIPAHGLLARSMLRTGGSAETPVEVAVPVALDRALGGDLRPGEHVVVLATFGTGADAWTEVVAGDAVLRAITTGDDRSITSGGATTMLLAFHDRPAAIAVVHAARTAELTFIRAEPTATDEAGRRYPPSTASTTGESG